MSHLADKNRFGGAIEELAEAWTSGRLGTDLDQVIDDATELSMAIFERVANRPAG